MDGVGYIAHDAIWTEVEPLVPYSARYIITQKHFPDREMTVYSDGSKAIMWIGQNTEFTYH